MEPCRPRQKHLVLDALYDVHCVPMNDVHEILEAIAAEWMPVFRRKDLDPEEKKWFLSFIEAAGVDVPCEQR